MLHGRLDKFGHAREPFISKPSGLFHSGGILKCLRAKSPSSAGSLVHRNIFCLGSVYSIAAVIQTCCSVARAAHPEEWNIVGMMI
jgi:hypothetical protein